MNFRGLMQLGCIEREEEYGGQRGVQCYLPGGDPVQFYLRGV